MFFREYFLPSTIALCVGIYAVIYLRGIKKGEVKPILATWLLFALSTMLSFVTDLSETGVGGILTNFFNLADSCAIVVILAVILCRKDTRRSFTLFEKLCMGSSLLVTLFWFISGQNVPVHLAIQVILVIAYVPTLKHLWVSTTNTESLPMWFFDFFASALGLVEPLRTMSLLPTIYTVRAVICTLLVIAFILRIQLRQNKNAAIVPLL
jgi:hypothetical protein